MKRIYEPVLVSPYEMNGVVNVYVVVDNPDMKLNYTLEIQVISWEVSCHLGEGWPLAGRRLAIFWDRGVYKYKQTDCFSSENF